MTSEGLEAITQRLEELARELEQDLEPDRAAELIREASDLAARAGREVDGTLRSAAEARES